MSYCVSFIKENMPTDRLHLKFGPQADRLGDVALILLCVPTTVCVYYGIKVLVPAQYWHAVGRAIGPTIVALAAALWLMLRPFIGFTLELDDDELRICPRGRLGRVQRFPLANIDWIEPWREDEPIRWSGNAEKSPRLHVHFKAGYGLLFGPWLTSNSERDFERVRLLVGELYQGDPYQRHKR